MENNFRLINFTFVLDINVFKLVLIDLFSLIFHIL